MDRGVNTINIRKPKTRYNQTEINNDVQDYKQDMEQDCGYIKYKDYTQK